MNIKKIYEEEKEKIRKEYEKTAVRSWKIDEKAIERDARMEVLDRFFREGKRLAAMEIQILDPYKDLWNKDVESVMSYTTKVMSKWPFTSAGNPVNYKDFDRVAEMPFIALEVKRQERMKEWLRMNNYSELTKKVGDYRFIHVYTVSRDKRVVWKVSDWARNIKDYPLGTDMLREYKGEWILMREMAIYKKNNEKKLVIDSDLKWEEKVYTNGFRFENYDKKFFNLIMSAAMDNYDLYVADIIIKWRS